MVIANNKPKATGYVSYDVAVHCPHCKKQIHLNQYPYVNDGDYELEDDELGKALFGTVTEPAQWGGFEITYKCCGCEKDFILNTLET